MSRYEETKVYNCQLEDQFKEMLDECYEPYKMCELTFLPSDILSSDPVAYREGLLEYIDAEIEDGRLFEKDGEYFSEDPDCDDDSEVSHE